MDDLISRQAAIDRINKQREHLQPDIYPQDKIGDSAYRICAEFIERLPSAQPATNCSEIPNGSDDTISRQAAIDAMKDALDPHIVQFVKAKMAKIAIEVLPSAQTEQRWIPCSERLPEENGQYLITVRYKHVDGYEDVYAEHGDWCDGNWDMFCFGHCGEVESIPAWMPLPEPYKGGDE